MTTTTALTAFGGRDEIKELGFRLQKMMPSAQSFTADEALAVAQIARAHDLDPFNGEVWGLKSYNGQWYGVMVGIKGLRKCARRAAIAENGSYWIDNHEVDPKTYKVTIKDAVVYECILRDSVNMQAYGQAVHSLTDSGIPYEQAVKMVGDAPCVIGVGIADPSEKSKMNLHARAKKRAEADALKQRYDVDFGNATFTVEEQGDVVDAEVTPDAFDQGVDADYPPEHSELENLSQLGFDTDEQPIQQSKAVPHPDLKKSKRETEKPDGPVGWLLDWGVDNTSHAAKIATLLKFTSSMVKKDAERKYDNYRSLRDSGKTAEEAAVEVLGAK